MNLVVDASALYEFFRDSPRAIDALDPPGSRRIVAHAPELIDPETLHTLRRDERRGVISPSSAARLLDRLARFPLVRHRHASLRQGMWAHRHNLSAYDAAYLALATRIHGCVLLTADAPLAGYAETVLGADRVRRV